jgi:hypothetical protein
MDRDEFREQMTRCPGCGQLSDGGCCPPVPLAFVVEEEYDTCIGPMEYHVAAVCVKRFYCLDCAQEYAPCSAMEPVYDKSALRNPYYREECCECGREL